MAPSSGVVFNGGGKRIMYPFTQYGKPSTWYEYADLKGRGGSKPAAAADGAAPDAEREVGILDCA